MRRADDPLDSFLTRVAVIKQESSPTYSTIEHKLEILYKYRVLRGLRTRQLRKFGVLNDESISQLIALQGWDDAAKQFVFNESIAMFSPKHDAKLESVFLLKALKILNQAPTTEKLVDILSQANQSILGLLKKWRQELDAQVAQKQLSLTWMSWFTEKAQTIKNDCYRFSLMGFGMQLGRAMGGQAGCWAGTGIGLAITYYFGAYYFIKTVLLGSLGLRITKAYRNAHVDDQYATMKPYPYYLQPTYIPQLINLASSGFEILYQSDPFPIVRRVMSNLSGAVSLMIAAWTNPTLLGNGTNPNEAIKATVARIAIFLVGVQLGAGFFSLLENGFINYQVNRAFLKFMQENFGDYFLKDSLIVDSPALSSIGFWFSRQQSVRLAWQTNSSSYLFENRCVLFQQGAERYATVICEETPKRFLALL